MYHFVFVAGVLLVGTAATTINGKIKGKSDAEIEEDCKKLIKPITRMAFRGNPVKHKAR